MMIATSILNSKDRINSVLKLNRTNTSYIHIDVMDGKFVSDTQFSLNEITAVNRVSKYPMDVHLMVSDPISYIVKLRNMNISYITFHLEIRKNKDKIIKLIKDMGYKVGISIKPGTDIEKLRPYLDDVDMILVMSVEPGLGGQKFIDATLDRIKEIKKLIGESKRDIKIEVDGGINGDNISKLSDVDIAVVGSYIIKSDNYYGQVEKILESSRRNVSAKNIINNNSFSKFLIASGLLLIFCSFSIDLGKTFDFTWLINSHPYIYLLGFFALSIGLFMRPIFKSNIYSVGKNKKEFVLKNEKLLYKILLFVGIMLYLILFLIWIYDCLNAGWKFEIFVVGMFFLIMLYWPIVLLGMLFIVVGMVRLNEIKRLSE